VIAFSVVSEYDEVKKRSAIMQTLSLAAIRKLKPCAKQYRLVKREWPDGVPVSIVSVRRAEELGVDVSWLAGNFLTGAARAEYEKVSNPALTEYKTARDAAWSENETVCDAALAENRTVCDAAWSEYETVVDAAWSEYRTVVDAAWSEYRTVVDAALVRAVRMQLRSM
jgi:hypothetical protein